MKPKEYTIHACPKCDRLTAIQEGQLKICLTCGAVVVPVGNWLPF